MRPITLRIAGFTSFRDEQTIEFGNLDLFAITGPTGSGKSSVLDAMTYALYGKAERVADGVKQLVSLGQPSARVELTFDVDGRQYRVTRETLLRGPTRILLQRQEADGSWAQFGPGADHVRDVEADVTKLLGLDYVAFSRSVLLPQGEFHRFLSGDTHERRNILTDLLGLRLFERMATLANQQSGLAATAAATARDLLEREYADVSDEALAAAEAEAAAATSHSAAVAAVRSTVKSISDRAASVERDVGQLEALAARADELVERASVIRDRVASLDSERHDLAAATTAAATSVAEAREQEQRAQADLARMIASSGGLTELEQGLRSVVEAETHLDAADRARASAARLGEELVGLGEAIAAATASVGECRQAETAATLALTAAGEHRHQVIEANAVAGLLVGRAAGDPCPVCGRPLEVIPSAPGIDELAEADRGVTAAQTAARTASQAVREAEAGLRDAQQAESSSQARVAALKATAADESTRGEALLTDLRRSLRLRPKDDVRSVIEARQAQVTTAQAAVANATDAVRAADRQLESRRSLEAVNTAAITARREALASLNVTALATEATTRLGIRHVWTGMASDADGAVLVTTAGAMTELAAEIGSEARAAAAEQRKLVTAALAEAQVAGAKIGIVADSLAAISTAAEEATEKAARRGERARVSVESLKARVGRRAELGEAIARDERRANIMRALGLALRSDRLIAFVQTEALDRLAIAASDRLAVLSGGRYRLACQEDEFEVVDTWNGDERRNVRTLSGGETFLASLALALALAEQLSSLAVGGHARLDSLFLDEGFGSLDPETLETVTSAVEALREGGRLVGLVTHVADLAERMPARFVVRKSPRGSTITREDVGIAAGTVARQ